MPAVASIAEIESQFDAEWVLIGNPKTDEALRVIEGEVLFHSKDRDEVHRKLLELRPRRFALRYLGGLPENTVIAL